MLDDAKLNQIYTWKTNQYGRLGGSIKADDDPMFVTPHIEKMENILENSILEDAASESEE